MKLLPFNQKFCVPPKICKKFVVAQKLWILWPFVKNFSLRKHSNEKYKVSIEFKLTSEQVCSSDNLKYVIAKLII